LSIVILRDAFAASRLGLRWCGIGPCICESEDRFARFVITRTRRDGWIDPSNGNCSHFFSRRQKAFARAISRSGVAEKMLSRGRSRSSPQT